MKTNLKLTTFANAQIIKNMWPLYRHDVSGVDGGFTSNQHGLLSGDDRHAMLQEYVDAETNFWWQNSKTHFPCLITADEKPVGFNLIAAREGLPKSIDADYVVHEFFILHPFRGKGIAEQAAIQGFHKHKGKWEICTWPNHQRAIAFWRKTMSTYTSNQYTEKECDHVWGRRVVFSFENT